MSQSGTILLINEPKLALGKMVASAGVSDRMNDPEFCTFVNKSLNRHAQCDWGNCSPGDAKLNDMGVEDGSRVLSSYEEGAMPKIWIISEGEGEHRVTTILFPEDY